MRLKMMSIARDMNLEPLGAVLVACLIEGLKINFGQIIVDDLFFLAHKLLVLFLFMPYHETMYEGKYANHSRS